MMVVVKLVVVVVVVVGEWGVLKKISSISQAFFFHTG